MSNIFSVFGILINLLLTLVSIHCMHLLQYTYFLSDHLTTIFIINILFLVLFVLSSTLSNSLLGLSKYFLKPCFLFCQSEIWVVISKSLWVSLIPLSLWYSLSMYFHASLCGCLLVCQHQMFFLHTKLNYLFCKLNILSCSYTIWYFQFIIPYIFCPGYFIQYPHLLCMDKFQDDAPSSLVLA